MLSKLERSSVILDDHHLFTSTDFDDLLNSWDHQHTISIDHWSHFPRRSHLPQQDTSLALLDEIKQAIDEYYTRPPMISDKKNSTLTRLSDQLKIIDNSPDNHIKRMDSMTSNLTHSHI